MPPCDAASAIAAYAAAAFATGFSISSRFRYFSCFDIFTLMMLPLMRDSFLPPPLI